MLCIVTRMATHLLTLKNKPCPILLHRMVRDIAGTVSIFHQHGILVLRCYDIVTVDYNDESAGAPWPYGEPD